MRRSCAQWQAMAVVVIVGVGLFVIACSIAALVINGWVRRHKRLSLLARLQLYQPKSVADEAQRWLEEHQS